MDKLKGTIFRDYKGKPCVYIDDSGSLQELVIRPNVSKYRNPPNKLMSNLYLGIAMFLLAILMTVVILELIVGCGEVTYLADGTWKSNECLFQTTDILTGTWK